MKRFWFTAKIYSLMKSIGKFNRLLNVLGGGGCDSKALNTDTKNSSTFVKGGGLDVVKDFSVYCFNNDRF